MRDVQLDNFKAILIALVVIGHAVEPLIRTSETLRGFYVFIYLFHMPMFAYASGVVSQVVPNLAGMRKIGITLLIPYLILQTAYSVFDYAVFERGTFLFSPLRPYWILWYLVSLASWRMLLPLFDVLRRPILAGLIVGLAAGALPLGYDLSLSRTFAFLPIFLIGHYGHAKISAWLRVRPGLRAYALCGLALTALSLCLVPALSAFDVSILYAAQGYAGTGLHPGLAWGLLTRCAFGIAALGLGLGLLSLMPRGRARWTPIGVHTLPIFVLHGFVIRAGLAAGLYDGMDGALWGLVLIPAALVLIVLLASPFVRRVTNACLFPLANLRPRTEPAIHR